MRVSSYRRRVVSKCLQVSHVGIDEPTSALDLGADVVVRSIGNEHSHTEIHRDTHTHTQVKFSKAKCYNDPFKPAEGSIATLRWISAEFQGTEVRIQTLELPCKLSSESHLPLFYDPLSLCRPQI